MSHKRFRQDVERALNCGLNLFIEGIIEGLDPGLEDVLKQSFYSVGNTLQVKIWDFETSVDPNFQLFITTQISNPVFAPDLLTSAVLIDFNVTAKGLEDQLLARVVSKERENLEKQRFELLNSTVENRKRLDELQASLLYRLAQSEGSLVDDHELLSVLNNTKKTSEEIIEQLVQAKETENEINMAREQYRPVAERGALIYFLIQDMSKINSMYETGLRQFLALFDDSLIHSKEASVATKRIHKILKYMTKRMWKFYTRGLYKKDFVMFTLSLALRIELQLRSIRRDEVDIFLKGGMALSLLNCPPKPAKWIPDNVWLNINAVSQIHAFESLVDQVMSNDKRWRRWYDKEAPEEEVFPFNYDVDLSPFERLILIRTWCPDRVVRQAKKYISETLGYAFAEENLLDLEETYADSTAKTPIMNLLTVGADPTLLIERLAKRLQVDLRFISMGQGQEVHARQYIEAAMRNGSWVLLQNCHLCLDYMTELFTLITEMKTASEVTRTASIRSSVLRTSSLDSGDSTSRERPFMLNGVPITPESFRLWVTTEEHPRFPVNFLQISVKFTNQPPEGLRSGLAKTFSDVSQDFLDACVSTQWRVVLYAVAFLHRTLEERRKYTPIGWSIPYEF
ncbi:unnamed protein product, partial [Mesocestoides corti]